jgi:hypothetical protein
MVRESSYHSHDRLPRVHEPHAGHRAGTASFMFPGTHPLGTKRCAYRGYRDDLRDGCLNFSACFQLLSYAEYKAMARRTQDTGSPQSHRLFSIDNCHDAYAKQTSFGIKNELPKDRDC